MAGRFVGRWADRTASRRVCRPYRVLFCFIPLGSIFVTIAFLTNATLISDSFDALPNSMIAFLRFTDSFILPRSLMELELIPNRYGSVYFSATFFSETLSMLSGMCAIAITLSRVVLRDVEDQFSTVQFLIRISIVMAFLVFRPINFTEPRLATNNVDESGLYLVKESVVIAAGYYQLALILTDAFGRVVSKSHGTPVDRQGETRTLHETKIR